MSHFATYKVQITNAGHLKTTLTEMGYEFKEGKVKMNNNYGQSTDVDIKLTKYPIGFTFNEKEQVYELVADWWGLGINQQEFKRQLNQGNAKCKVTEFCAKNRLTPGQWQTDEHGQLTMVATQWS